MREIELGNNKKALVDDGDFDALSRIKWHLSRGRYAAGRVLGKRVYLHRFMLGINDSRVVDHINGDTLDNRRANLRSCSDAQNAFNRRPRTDSLLGVKGVEKHGRKYRVRITFHGKRIRVGEFTSITEAAKAYDSAAQRYFGEYAKTNF